MLQSVMTEPGKIEFRNIEKPEITSVMATPNSDIQGIMINISAFIIDNAGSDKKCRPGCRTGRDISRKKSCASSSGKSGTADTGTGTFAT